MNATKKKRPKKWEKNSPIQANQQHLEFSYHQNKIKAKQSQKYMYI